MSRCECVHLRSYEVDGLLSSLFSVERLFGEGVIWAGAFTWFFDQAVGNHTSAEANWAD